MNYKIMVTKKDNTTKSYLCENIDLKEARDKMCEMAQRDLDMAEKLGEKTEIIPIGTRVISIYDEMQELISRYELINCEDMQVVYTDKKVPEITISNKNGFFVLMYKDWYLCKYERPTIWELATEICSEYATLEFAKNDIISLKKYVNYYYDGDFSEFEKDRK